MRTVTINGVSVTIENEIYEHFNNDDELETIEIVIKNSTQLEPYDMGLQVVITDTTVDYYYTGADNVSRAGLNPNTFNHRITLIEAYKGFEREVLSSLQYTQPLDGTKYTCLDVVDRALKLLTIEKTSDLGASRQYDIEGIGTRDANDSYVVGNLSGLALQLYNKKAPEMQFNTPSLREVIDEVFLLFDGRPKLTTFDTIDIQYFNEKGDSININTVSEISGSQSIDKNAQKFDIYMENAISENNLNKQARVYPSTNAWASVRSKTTELTTTNFLMEVASDIERVLEFRCYANVDINYVDDLGATQNYTGLLNVDMTDYLFTKRAWDALEYEFSNWTSQPYKTNSVYFQNNQILGWDESIDKFDPTIVNNVYNWHAFLGQMLVESNPSGGVANVLFALANKPQFVNDVSEFMFRLTYVPKETTRIQLERDKSSGFGVLRANQTARVVDAELLGNNMQSKLNRDGEKTLSFSKLVDSYSEVFNLNDYYNDYIGHKLDNIRYYNGQVLSTLTLSKNYVKRSERVNTSNKPRQTQISAENTIRNDIISEYIKVETVGDTKTASITNDGIDRLLKTFDPASTTDNPVEFATWEDEIIVETTSQGIGKTMALSFQFPDNITAGKQTATLDTIEGNKYVEYAVDGEIDNATIKYYGEYAADPSTYANIVAAAKMLPLYDSTITLGDALVDLGERRILKDSGEVYGLTYQLTFATEDDDIFIGNKLAQENAFVVKNTEALYLYSQLTPFTFGQNIDSTVSKQLLVTGTPTASTQVKIEITNIFGIGKLQFTTNFNSGKFWAIANIKGEVYLIVNKLLTDSIFLNFKEKRSD